MGELYRGVVVVKKVGELNVNGVVVNKAAEYKQYYHTKAYTKIGSARGQLTILRKRFKASDVVEWYTERVSEWERVD